MIGKSAARSSWLPELALPVALIVAEAGWVSLLVRARVVGSYHVRIDLPFLAVAVPGVLATTTSVWLQRLRLPRRPRRLVIWVTVIVGMTASAGLISGLSVPGSEWLVATHPWASPGHRAATVAGTAWLIAILAWLRGGWLGSLPVSFRHVVWSFTLAGVAFLGVFIGHAASPHGGFARTTSDAGWLFFVTFPLAAAAVALVRQRDLEEEVLAKASRPGLVWVSVLAVPMAVVAGVGLALAIAGGPAAPVVGRAIGRGARIVGRGIAYLLSRLPVFNVKLHASKPSSFHTTAHGLRVVKPGATNPVVVYIGLALLGLIVIGLVILVVYLVKRFWPKRRGEVPTEAGDDEEDSVFSWAHLWAQLRAALGRMRPRRRKPRRLSLNPVRGPDGGVDPGLPPRPDGVREAYRRMLLEARALGSPRRRAETPLELQDRLILSVQGPATASFNRLTDVYDDVRYGDTEAGRDGDLQARDDVEVVVTALRAALAPPEPDEAVPGGAPAPTASSGRSGTARSRLGRPWLRRRSR